MTSLSWSKSPDLAQLSSVPSWICAVASTVKGMIVGEQKTVLISCFGGTKSLRVLRNLSYGFKSYKFRRVKGTHQNMTGRFSIFFNGVSGQLTSATPYCWLDTWVTSDEVKSFERGTHCRIERHVGCGGTTTDENGTESELCSTWNWNSDDIFSGVCAMRLSWNCRRIDRQSFVQQRVFGKLWRPGKMVVRKWRNATSIAYNKLGRRPVIKNKGRISPPVNGGSLNISCSSHKCVQIIDTVC